MWDKFLNLIHTREFELFGYGVLAASGALLFSKALLFIMTAGVALSLAWKAYGMGGKKFFNGDE